MFLMSDKYAAIFGSRSVSWHNSSQQYQQLNPVSLAWSEFLPRLLMSYYSIDRRLLPLPSGIQVSYANRTSWVEQG